MARPWRAPDQTRSENAATRIVFRLVAKQEPVRCQSKIASFFTRMSSPSLDLADCFSASIHLCPWRFLSRIRRPSTRPALDGALKVELPMTFSLAKYPRSRYRTFLHMQPKLARSPDHLVRNIRADLGALRPARRQICRRRQTIAHSRWGDRSWVVPSSDQFPRRLASDWRKCSQAVTRYFEHFESTGTVARRRRRH